jgi:two-component system NtrC family sensor kinase
MTSVLYVDDEPAIRRAVHLWLQRYGIAVRSTGTVQEAVALLERERMDGAFIDVWLEDGTGFELYDWIREHDARLAQRVVFVTGDTLSDPTILRRLRTLGVPTMVKPFDLEELKAHAARWGRESGEAPRPDAAFESPPPMERDTEA